ncbi:MAG: BamA/TamA family outer membrane protein [Cyclobacteriaceae bacterium]|jgi:outer membrane protein assembly factor BamA|nr:BamA/TamA family outer membrane protein [Cyclobacteriaceae bacterium]
MNRSTAYKLFILVALAFTGCTGMKNISVDDPLYIGHEVKYKVKEEKNKKLTPTFKSVLKPAPNKTLLWMRPSLALNNTISDKGKKRKFWKRKVEEPVLLSQTNPAQVATAIQNRIFHNGYFQNTVVFDTVRVGHRKAKLVYTINLNKPYHFESVGFPKPTNDLTQKISDRKSESLLKKDDIYTLEAIKNERIRIDQNLKENGYIFFNPEFIAVKADSVTGDHQIRAEITVKPETPPESKVPYTIRKIFIHDDYTLDNALVDTLRFGNYYLISQHKALRPDALQQGIFLKPGEVYSRSNYMHTIRYMNELPIIRNASIKFLPYNKTDSLDVSLYLSQRKRYAYSAEFNVIARSTNYFGPGVIFSFTDRNRNKGSEMLKVNLRGRVEVQIVDGEVNPAYELGLEVNYQLPRFYPEFLFNTAKKSLPKTNITAGYNLFNRLDLYRLNSLYANFGYRWSKNNRVTHSFNPAEIIFTKIPEDSKSEEFNQYLQENPGVQRSFDEQFILGTSYEFTYQPAINSRNDFFFRGGIDLAGNLLNGLYSAANAEKDSLGRYSLLGIPFSQYTRLRVDVRYSFNLNQRSKLVTRFTTGVGIPLNNSDVIPYIKQFYVGGTNSLRSFIARSVGPGSEVPPGGYNDLTGDIRLEGNVEYRFNISGKLKGALFMDAGNIWLYKEDASRPNGNFRFDTFVDEIAVSSGWGLRWDFDFLVARLDFAYTVRTPYLPAGERWTTEYNFWKPAINIAIGYPF